MRGLNGLVVLLAAFVAGAACFHLYYRGLDAASRCDWDHPLDGDRRRACIAAARGPLGYDTAARHALDRLVGNVAR